MRAPPTTLQRSAPRHPPVTPHYAHVKTEAEKGKAMFTEGLDNSALKWVKGGSVGSENSVSISNQRNQVLYPAMGIRNGGRGGFGLPPPGKYRSGHLPASAIPLSRVISGNDSVSGDDMEMTSESEVDVYGGRYSLDSSPQDDHIPSSSATNVRYGNNGALRRRASYTSDYSISDVNSSVEFSKKRGGNVAERLVNGGGRHPSVGRDGYMEVDCESSDSAASSEFSSAQVGTSSGIGSRPKAYASEGYASSATSRMNAESAANKMPEKTIVLEDLIHIAIIMPPYNNRKSFDDDDIPSAPPFSAPCEEATRSTDNDIQARAQSKISGAQSPLARPAKVASSEINTGLDVGKKMPDSYVREAPGDETAGSSGSHPPRLPTFHASLQQTLLLSEEEILSNRASELTVETAALKPKKMIGKMKVQVRKVRMGMEPTTGCSFRSLKAPTIKLQSARNHLAKLRLKLSSGWTALRRVRFVLHKPADGSLSRKSLAYVQAGTQYMKQVSGLLKVGVTTLRQSSTAYEAVQVQDSKGTTCGRVLAQVAVVADDPSEKLRWWSIYHEPEHEFVGKLQLYISFSTSADENGHLKCGSVAETVAYDLVLEVAMKAQNFQQRHLLIHGEWRWLLDEFASYYGVSDAYTKLRYLSYVMDVATPTADCLTLVYDLLYPVVMKGNVKSLLSHQENRILGEIQDEIEHILALAFENYKSLDESFPSGIIEVFKPATGVAAPALPPAVKLYTLLYDILTPEAQTKLCSYFQAAARKRSKRHLAETDEYVAVNTEGIVVDNVAVSTAYQKMKVLCLNIRNEVFTDIQIHDQHILPSFVDLPHLASSIYSLELCNRIREFLIACPPSGLSPPVAELVIATADFQRDLANWNICPVRGGVDAKELFHLYIVVWIKDRRAAMLESCRLDKVKWSGVRTPHATTPFLDDMYGRLKETLNEYEVIICRWPEYIFVLENAVADVEKAIVEALDKQYADVLAPLKETMMPKKFGIKYVQKLTKRSMPPYVVPEELGILLNSLKRMLDVLRPKIESQFKTWGSCIPEGSNQVLGERLSEVTVMLRTKFRNYVQAVVEKLVENTRSQNATKLKKILQDSKESASESDVRARSQFLKEMLTSTINQLHSVLETHVFISACRGFWDRMGQDVLTFLDSRKENRSWYKSCRLAVSILDDTFASQMQQLLGNTLQDKDIEPPRSITEVRSMLCKESQTHKDNSFYF
ncbi:hypothetical protein AKJ16_DCAP12869 [Drosera capensis]